MEREVRRSRTKIFQKIIHYLQVRPAAPLSSERSFPFVSRSFKCLNNPLCLLALCRCSFKLTCVTRTPTRRIGMGEPRLYFRTSLDSGCCRPPGSHSTSSDPPRSVNLLLSSASNLFSLSVFLLFFAFDGICAQGASHGGHQTCSSPRRTGTSPRRCPALQTLSSSPSAWPWLSACSSLSAKIIILEKRGCEQPSLGTTLLLAVLTLGKRSKPLPWARKAKPRP